MEQPGLLAKPPKTAPDLADATPAARPSTPLEATAQLLTFAPGFYAIDFVTTQSANTDTGLRLPCARLEPVPPGPGQSGRCFVSVMAEGGWLSQSDQPAFIRVVGGGAAVMLTLYTVAGEIAPPEVRIRKLQANAPAPAPAKAAGELASLPVLQLVHIQTVGDVTAPAGQWAGQRGSLRQIEGFSLQPGTGLKAADIEYQAILGQQWNTPWAQGGGFCGSRGMGLPLLGFRVRLLGKLAETHACTYWGSFANKGVVGPVTDGAACEADGSLLEAMRITVVARPLRAAPGHAVAPPDMASPQTENPVKKPGRTRARQNRVVDQDF